MATLSSLDRRHRRRRRRAAASLLSSPSLSFSLCTALLVYNHYLAPVTLRISLSLSLSVYHSLGNNLCLAPVALRISLRPSLSLHLALVVPPHRSRGKSRGKRRRTSRDLLAIPGGWILGDSRRSLGYQAHGDRNFRPATRYS